MAFQRCARYMRPSLGICITLCLTIILTEPSKAGKVLLPAFRSFEEISHLVPDGCPFQQVLRVNGTWTSFAEGYKRQWYKSKSRDAYCIQMFSKERRPWQWHGVKTEFPVSIADDVKTGISTGGIDCTQGSPAFRSMMQRHKISHVLLIGDSQFEQLQYTFSYVLKKVARVSYISLRYDQKSSSPKAEAGAPHIHAIYQKVEDILKQAHARLLVIVNIGLHYDGIEEAYDILYIHCLRLSILFSELRMEHRSRIQIFFQSTQPQHFPRTGDGVYRSRINVGNCSTSITANAPVAHDAYLLAAAAEACIPTLDFRLSYADTGYMHIHDGTGRGIDCTHYCNYLETQQPVFQGLCEMVNANEYLMASGWSPWVGVNHFERGDAGADET